VHGEPGSVTIPLDHEDNHQHARSLLQRANRSNGSQNANTIMKAAGDLSLVSMAVVQAVTDLVPTATGNSSEGRDHLGKMVLIAAMTAKAFLDIAQEQHFIPDAASQSVVNASILPSGDHAASAVASIHPINASSDAGRGGLYAAPAGLDPGVEGAGHAAHFQQKASAFGDAAVPPSESGSRVEGAGHAAHFQQNATASVDAAVASSGSGSGDVSARDAANALQNASATEIEALQASQTSQAAETKRILLKLKAAQENMTALMSNISKDLAQQKPSNWMNDIPFGDFVQDR